MATVMDVLKKLHHSLLTIDGRTTVREAAALFVEYGVGSFPVEEEEEICGIITERDLTSVIADPAEEPDELMVSELMSERVIVASPEDDVEEAMRVMATSQIHHLPVVASGEIIGIVSMNDLVRFYDSGAPHRLHYMEHGVCPVCGGESEERAANGKKVEHLHIYEATG